jgi:hypothetical protein
VLVWAPKDVLVALQFPGDKTAVPIELSRLDCNTPKALMHRVFGSRMVAVK